MMLSGAVLFIFVSSGASFGPPEQPSTVGNATEGGSGGGGNSTSDNEDVATTTHVPSSAPADLPMSRFLEPATTQTTSQAPEEGPGPGFNAMTILSSTKVLEHLRYAVVRIQAVQADNDWFKPWEPFGEKQGVGTGFIVASDKNGVLIVTNAHVVENALSVQVQLPVLGQAEYDAHVPLICNTFDLALVYIANPKKLHEAVEAQNQTLRTLKMRSTPIEIGSEVAAFGFPLGSLSPKLSRGVISGIEQIGDQVSYQTTAPISPGNSGGPLLAYGQNKELEVAGVTFASATAAGTQNNNYVVPALRVEQVLREFKTVPKKKIGIGVLGTPLKTGKDGKVEVSSLIEAKKPDHRQLQLAPFGAITVEANDALYNESDGCNKGVFISSLLPLSLLRFAEPPVKAHSFLVAVGDTKIDSFGMGSTPLFLGGPIPFEGLLALGKSPGDVVKLRTCKDGKEKTHNASLSWREEYTPGIDEVTEPLYSTKSTEFEVFSGITIMQMTVNHIASLMSHGAPVTLGRWLLPDNQLKPRLIVTHIAPNTYASHILASGMVITSLNGNNISTLNDFRDHFIPEGPAWELETDRGLLYTVNFREVVEKQLADSQRIESNRYLMTKTISQAAEKLGISTQGGGASKNLLSFSMSNSKGNSTDSISGTGDRPTDSPKAPESPLGVGIERHVSPGRASLAEEAATAAAAQATAAAKVAELAAAQATAAGNLARKAEADEKTADRKTADEKTADQKTADETADFLSFSTKVSLDSTGHGTLGHSSSSIVF